MTNNTTNNRQETAMDKSKVSVMGMVRDVLVDFGTASPGSHPWAWAEAEDKPSGRKVAVDKESAAEMARWMMQAREWATVACVFKDAQRKNNALRHTLRIAHEFAEIAGIELDAPVKLKKQDGTETKVELPTEPIEDLVPGDEVMVVRHVTRYGLDLIERFPAKVKGRADNGDYWLTSLDSGGCRACRPNEVIVTKRASAQPAEDIKPAKKTKKEA